MPEEMPVIDPDALRQFLDNLGDEGFRISFMEEPMAACEGAELVPGLPQEFIEEIARLTPEEIEVIIKISDLMKRFRLPPVPLFL